MCAKWAVDLGERREHHAQKREVEKVGGREKIPAERGRRQ